MANSGTGSYIHVQLSRQSTSSCDSRLTDYFRQESLIFGRLACVSVHRICIKFLPEVCLEPRNNWLNFKDDLDNDSDYDPYLILDFCGFVGSDDVHL